MNKRKIATLCGPGALLIALSLSGCGLKGDLYLQEEPPPDAQPAAAAGIDAEKDTEEQPDKNKQTDAAMDNAASEDSTDETETGSQ